METKKLKTKSATEILMAIKELIIEKHGIPNSILSDNGLEFKNEQVTKLCKDLNFTWEFSSPRHHETVGSVERANQTLVNILKSLHNLADYLGQNALRKQPWHTTSLIIEALIHPRIF